MPLLSYSDTQAPALGGQLSVRQVMKTKLEMGKMPPPSTPTGPLTGAEKATLMGWLDSGAPVGAAQASCDRDRKQLLRVDVELGAKATTDIRCDDAQLRL